MDGPTQHDYLQAMGIVVWQARAQAVSLQGQVCLIYRLRDKDNTLRGYMLADLSQTDHPDELALVEKIANALVDHIESVGVVAYEELQKFQNYPGLLVVLGKDLAELLCGQSVLRGNFYPMGSARMIATYAPAQLLSDSVLKKQAWLDLKEGRLI